MEISKSFRHITLYGLIIAVLIFALKWMQWRFLILENAIDIYLGLIALFFTSLGIWVASQMIKPQTQTIFVEKEVKVSPAETFVVNEAALKQLELTDREYQILQLIAKGYSNAEIAKQLFLSLSTIKTHNSNLYSKMHVKSRFQAIVEAKKLNIIA